jgi:hypothetical protein
MTAFIVRRNGQHYSYCKICRKKYMRKHYQQNKQYYIDKAAESKRVLQDEVRKLKSDTPCIDCKQIYPYYVMDFDHKRDKLDSVSRMTNSGLRKKVYEEIEKCDLVCANCHRIRTFDRLNNFAE